MSNAIIKRHDRTIVPNGAARAAQHVLSAFLLLRFLTDLCCVSLLTVSCSSSICFFFITYVMRGAMAITALCYLSSSSRIASPRTMDHINTRMVLLACCNAKGQETARTAGRTRNKHEDGHSRIRGFSSEESRRRDNASRGGVTDEYNRNDRRSRYDDDDDYYRSRSRDDGDKDRQPPKRPKQKRAWPPPFDTDGALYVFDSRSGFFYEAESNFYYDPKSRYYYSIEKAAYFQYCPEQEPPFRQVPSQQHGEIDTSTAVEASTGAAAAGSKMKIAISLKTKTPRGVTSSSGGSGGGTVSVNSSMDTGAMNPAKQTSPTEYRGIKQSKAAYDADIVKWNHARSINAHNSKASDSPDTEATNISAPKTTKTGQPVCLLCRRKFPNIEALQKHEQSSALHEQNLAKKDKDAAKTSKSTWRRSDNPSVEYRDRAKDRRSMYGADVSGAVPSVASPECSPSAIISSASADFGPNLERARAVAATATVRPSDTFGDSNIGSQMLQKIGWKKGSSLGRKKSLETGNNSDGTSDRPEGSNANIQMLKEWEKIESAAAAAPPTASSSFRSGAREGGTSSSRRACPRRGRRGA